MELEGLNDIRVKVACKLSETIEELLEAIAASPELAMIDSDVIISQVMQGILLIPPREQLERYLRAQREEAIT